MIRLLPLSCLLLLALSTAPAAAQDNVVVQPENVRYDYARVLRVTPVYQTLTATRVEEECEPSPGARDEGGSRLSRMVDAVRDALSRDKGKDSGSESGTATVECHPVQVERQFQRPIAYDVDYLYKGAKYRSRLAEDPGNRLRIRVSISPVASAASGR